MSVKSVVAKIATTDFTIMELKALFVVIFVLNCHKLFESSFSMALIFSMNHFI